MRFDTRTQTNAAAPPGKRRKSSVPKSPPSDWGLTRKKVPGSRSKNVFNVAGFQGHESPPPPTPMQNTVHQLTDAKVLAQPTPDGYQPLVLPGTLLLPWAMGASAAGKKRKRGDDDESDACLFGQGQGRGGRRRRRQRRRPLVGTGLRSPCRASCGRSKLLLCTRTPPRCRPLTATLPPVLPLRSRRGRLWKRTRTRAMTTATHRRYRTEKSVSYEMWPLEAPSMYPHAPGVGD